MPLGVARRGLKGDADDGCVVQQLVRGPEDVGGVGVRTGRRERIGLPRVLGNRDSAALDEAVAGFGV